ncbi:efflux RND transporter periplasmic adaptor subunit [Coralloluteibacterium thermophilus]|uniref:Efflux RND transporter periplasmic adaptor subunit n=1 Tax=Coralloluteibacterium thermophilum TaxID=2707049 RepID=A0ABV9NM92_9GAMM
MISKRRSAAAFAALAVLLLTAGCRDSGAPSGGPGGMPPAVVTVQEMQPTAWRDSIQALGTTRANESVTITAKVNETVRRVNFESGDAVRAGQLLVDLSGNTQLAELEEARAAYEEAERLFRRNQELAARQLVAESALDAQRAVRDAARARMEQVRAQLGDRAITAPFDGVLGLRQVSPGALVTPGTPIANLDDISIMKVDFSVPEVFLGQIGRGQAVTARSAAFRDLEFQGEVMSLDSRVDPVSRAVTVRAEFPNPDGVLRPGMLMTVDLLQPERQVLALPEIALVQIGREASVFRVDENQIVTQVPVTVGARRRGEVEIVEGLAAGDRVVIDGTVKLRSGMTIDPRPRGTASGSEHAPVQGGAAPAVSP